MSAPPRHIILEEVNIGTHYDIAVVGGGVAGIVSALCCARYGFRVLLCIKDGLSPHALQSVHASVLNSLADIGIDDAAFHDCLTPSRAKIYWGQPELDTSGREPTLLLDRSAFDVALLMAIKAAGIHIVSDAKGFLWSYLDERWKICAKNGSQQYISNYLINASGYIHGKNKTLLRQSEKTLALRAQWYHPPKLENNACTYIDSSAYCWFWGATLVDKSNLNIFLEPKDLKDAMKNGEGLDNLFQQLYARFRWRRDMPDPDHAKFDIVSATSYVSTNPINRQMALVGGAAIRIDPLSSQGIHVAITTAVQAAIAVNTLLKRPTNQADAIEFYCQSLKKRSDSHVLFQRIAYAEAQAKYKTEFWSKRAQKEPLKDIKQSFLLSSTVNYYCRYCLSKDAQFEYKPAIERDFVKSLPCLSHPNLKEHSFIVDMDIIKVALKQLLEMPLIMVVNHPYHRQYCGDLKQLLAYWVSCGVLEKIRN